MRKAIWKKMILGAALALLATEAAAQSTCNQRKEVIGHLAKKYGEAPVALGVTNKGGLVEVLTSGDGGTWTIIVSLPNGTSCMVATGQGWRSKDYDGIKLAPTT